MNSIIGLIRWNASVSPAVERVKEAGVADEQIQTISNPNIINNLLRCDPACVIRNYAVWGITIGFSVYAIFGIAAALCQCNILEYGREFGVGAFFGAILTGTFIGGIIGILVGAGEAEKDTHLYVQGVRLGGTVISVQVQDEDVERVKNILIMENVSGVKVLSLGEASNV
jgi:hypothetical protein